MEIKALNFGGMATAACVGATVVIHLENIGGMAERFKAPVLKTGKGESSSQVRILFPPFFFFIRLLIHD